MKYFPPVGSADPDAPYVDESSGQEGSAVPAKAIEFPQREIVTVVKNSGLVPDENSVTQLDEAIDLKIALAIGSGGGGGGSPVNDLLLLLRSRNPVFPEVNTADGSFNLTVVSAGNLQIPAGISVTHRGCFNDVTSLQNLTTVANKTYHLRKNWTTGWALRDLADPAYNPGALAETNVAFDTSYDDMLTHRVVTNASNIATITPLKNKNGLDAQIAMQGINERSSSDLRERVFDFEASLNWARRPRLVAFNWAQKFSAATTTGGDSDHFLLAYGSSWNGAKLTQFPFNRYGSRFAMLHDDWDTSLIIVYDAHFVL